MGHYYPSFENTENRIKDLIVRSAILGVSELKKSLNLVRNNVYFNLLLLDKNSDLLYKDDTGILIEYGYFSPDMHGEEKVNLKNKYAIYHYGEKGGLRYYAIRYNEFKREFGDIGYIYLNINKNEQISFENFIDKVVPKNENKWIKDKFSIFSFNSQSFVIDALQKLNVYFSLDDIIIKKENVMTPKIEKLDYFPIKIKEELKKYLNSKFKREENIFEINKKEKKEENNEELIKKIEEQNNEIENLKKQIKELNNKNNCLNNQINEKNEEIFNLKNK